VTFDLRHALAVAARCPASLWLEGLLHDALEDTDLTARDLLAAGVPDEVVGTVIYLTRAEGETYSDYIERVQANPFAKAVKLADLRVNLARMDAAHESLRPRYDKAVEALTRFDL
jgi:hypothetical protein